MLKVTFEEKCSRSKNDFDSGRLAIADPLCYMKELAISEVNPYLFTIATLTGHAARAYGPGYTVRS